MNEFIDNFKDIVTNKYAQFTGRADRKEFWYFVAVMVAINIVFSILASIVGGVSFLRWTFLILQGLVSLALLVPSIAVGVRRLHDIGKGGEWILINLVPIIGSLWFLILTIKESEPKPNKFG
ncbi:DUF805 domain-containing protein [Petrimonas mucosa]|uniref:DUF805 domain-containing protein n=1 Tax=Petrimonas mucosa TaxID=1642646 RepID=UPI001776BD41|nr:DUF805 domain-containing protein [Petrimonas mucosa]HHT28980.1 DUF805 domain-containing protein [Petrimonas mucosa]